MKSGVTKVNCSCTHPMQDRLHGVGVRVANATKKQDKDYAEVRCTVCGKPHRTTPSKIK